MHSLFKFKTTVGATTVVWETCAPGHGKGPWDGIGAVVKRFVRLLEKHSKLYADGARDVFCALVDQFLKEKAGSSVVIRAFVFHYILSQGEPPLPDRSNVWSAIVRPSARPAVTVEFAAPFVFVLQASLFLLSGNSPADMFVVLSTAGRIAQTQMQVIGNM